MAQYTTVHSYQIKHNGDVHRCLDYFERQWNDPKVVEIFKEAKHAGSAGYQFSYDTYGYTLYRDGDYEYTLRPR